MPIRDRRLASLLGLLVLLALPAQAQTPPDGRLRVVASFSILADLVRQVGGERVAVSALVGPDRDAHTFQPAPGDARELAGAAVAVENGLGFEGWITRLIQVSGFKGTRIIASDGVKTLTATDGHGHAHGRGGRAADPHAWQDIANTQLYVRNIEAGLTRADPAGAAGYRANAARHAAALAALESWVRTEIASVPAGRRRVITSHDAFGYFERAYGVRFLAPAGLRNDSEPTAAGVTALIRQIRREGIKTLFVETIASPRVIQQVARETGARVGGALYSDALSAPDGPAPTYVAMFRHNVDALVAAMRPD